MGRVTRVLSLWSHSVLRHFIADNAGNSILSGPRDARISRWMFFKVHFAVGFPCDSETVGFVGGCCIEFALQIVVGRWRTIIYTPCLKLPCDNLLLDLNTSLVPYPMPAHLVDFMLGKS